MKRLLAVALIFAVLFSLCGCKTNENVSQTKTVQNLLDEGEIKEAYALLYENRDDEEARKILEDFTVVCTCTFTKNYSLYNAFKETTYNQYGDVINEIEDYELNNYDIYNNDTYEYTYDSKGNILTCIKYNQNNEKIKQINYTYDESGNLVKEQEIYGETEAEIIEYKYDERGNNIETNSTSNGEFQYSYQFTYDANGNKIKEIYKSNLAEFSHEISYSYDKNGILIKTVEIKNDCVTTTEYVINEHGDNEKKIVTYEYDRYKGTENEKIVYEYLYELEYDANGNKTKNTEHNPDGQTRSDEYVYNENGDVIKQISHDINGDIRAYENQYEYNENGEIIKETIVSNYWREVDYRVEYDEHGNMISEKSGDREITYSYTYNEQGLVVSKTKNNTDGTSDKYEFVYDDSKNVIKETIYNNGNTEKPIITEYTYDEFGNVATKKCNDEDYDSTIEYSYNEHGDLISENKVAYGESVEKKTYEYTYGENGNMLSKTNIDKDGKKKRHYVYDEKGNEISIVYYDAQGVEGLWYEKEYDDNCNLIKQTVFSPEDGEKTVLYTETYTYDELGNALTMLREGQPYLGDSYAVYAEYSEYLYFYTPQ